MSKKMKKLFSFLLVLTMTLAINVNTFAFADSKKTVNVQIQAYGETYINETVDLDELQAKLKAKGTDHLYSTEPYKEYKDNGIKTSTAADAMIFAYNEFYKKEAGAAEVTPLLDTNYPNTETAISYNWDVKPYKGNPGIYFIYFDGMTTANSQVVSNPNGTQTWTGDTWTLSIDGVKSELYASNIALKDGMTIIFDYNKVSETW